MRIDVHFTEAMVERELADAGERLSRDGLLHAHDWRPTPVCDVSWLARQTPEHRFVYLKDACSHRVVGLFSFQSSRLRRAPLAVAVPHGKVHRQYRGLGLAGWVYRNTLRSGVCLMSSARQSVSAARLWQGLAREFAHGYVWVEGRSMRYLGTQLGEQHKEQLPVRQLLHGHGVDPIELFNSHGARGRLRRGGR